MGSLRAGAARRAATAQVQPSPAVISPVPPLLLPTYPFPPGARKLSAAAESGTGPGAGAAAFSQRYPRGAAPAAAGSVRGAGAAPPPLRLPLANAGCGCLRGGGAGAAVGPRRGGRKTLRLAGGTGKRRRRCRLPPPAEEGRGEPQAHPRGRHCRGSRLGERGESVTPRLRSCSYPPPRSALYESGGRGDTGTGRGKEGGLGGGSGATGKQAFARAPGIPASAGSPPQPPPGWSDQLPRSPAVPLPPAALPRPRRAHPGRETHGRRGHRAASPAPGELGTAPGSGA